MIHLAVATDRRYLPFAATAIASILRAEPGTDITVHALLGRDVDERSVGDLEAFVSSTGGELKPHRPADARLRSLPGVGRFGDVVWLRFLLPDIIDAPRVLFVDADTFALRPIRPLWEADLQGAPLGAVSNVVEPAMRPHVHSLGISDHRRFLNSGVLLMDLDAMRAADDVGRLLRYASDRASDLVWPDQDALNAVFADRWTPLHPRWNAMNSLWIWRPWAEEVFGAAAVEQATNDPALLHFEGPHVCKPWHFLSTHTWRAQYRSELDRTPWAPVELDDRRLATRAIALLPERYWGAAYLRLKRGEI